MPFNTIDEMGTSVTVPPIAVVMLPVTLWELVTDSIEHSVEQLSALLKSVIDRISEFLYGPPMWTEGPSALAWFLNL